MSDDNDLLRAMRYECADPATTVELAGNGAVRRLQQLVAERRHTPAAVVPIRARR